MTELAPDIRRHLRDDLRGARGKAFRDAEAFDQVLFALERTGCVLSGSVKALGEYKDDFMYLLKGSA